jgi:hypothetical protein
MTPLAVSEFSLDQMRARLIRHFPLARVHAEARAWAPRYVGVLGSKG